MGGHPPLGPVRPNSRPPLGRRTNDESRYSHLIKVPQKDGHGPHWPQYLKGSRFGSRHASATPISPAHMWLSPKSLEPLYSTARSTPSLSVHSAIDTCLGFSTDMQVLWDSPRWFPRCSPLYVLQRSVFSSRVRCLCVYT